MAACKRISKNIYGELVFVRTGKPSVFNFTGLFCWASFVILQAHTLKSFPAELSLTSLICLMGSLEGAAVALVAERGNTAIWAISFDIKLLAAVYGVSIQKSLQL
ncbi:unnamed protein product [Rhodiola kirilowii]